MQDHRHASATRGIQATHHRPDEGHYIHHERLEMVQHRGGMLFTPGRAHENVGCINFESMFPHHQQAKCELRNSHRGRSDTSKPDHGQLTGPTSNAASDSNTQRQLNKGSGVAVVQEQAGLKLMLVVIYGYSITRTGSRTSKSSRRSTEGSASSEGTNIALS
jgi:hypothetical protein